MTQIAETPDEDIPDEAIVGPLRVLTDVLVPGRVWVGCVHDQGDDDAQVTFTNTRAHRTLRAWEKQMCLKNPGKVTAIWSLAPKRKALRFVYTAFRPSTKKYKAIKPARHLAIWKVVLSARQTWMVGVHSRNDKKLVPLDNACAWRVLGIWLQKMAARYPHGAITGVSQFDEDWDPMTIVYTKIAM